MDEQIKSNSKLGVILWNHNFDNLAEAMEAIGESARWNNALVNLYSLADKLRDHRNQVARVGWGAKKTKALLEVIDAMPYVYGDDGRRA